MTSAAESVVAYGNYCDLRDAGETGAAEQTLTEIADYNRADCCRRCGCGTGCSRAPTSSASPGRSAIATAGVVEEPEPVEARLRAYADGTAADRSPDQTAAALMAAAIGYHRRERKPFWWAHFDRLARPVDEWPDTDDVLVVTAATTLRGWHKEGGSARCADSSNSPDGPTMRCRHPAPTCARSTIRPCPRASRAAPTERRHGGV